jgi:uncharacterized MAPEG superfamily protein
MAPELQFLGWSVVLGFGYVFVASGIATHERGLRWNAGNRDGDPKPLSPLAERARRASLNFLETFPFFAATAVAVVVAHRNSAQTALGCELYLAARVVYLPVYLIGIPYLRTLVYGVSLWGILQLIEALLGR